MTRLAFEGIYVYKDVHHVTTNVACSNLLALQRRLDCPRMNLRSRRWSGEPCWPLCSFLLWAQLLPSHLATTFCQRYCLQLPVRSYTPSSRSDCFGCGTQHSIRYGTAKLRKTRRAGIASIIPLTPIFRAGHQGRRVERPSEEAPPAESSLQKAGHVRSCRLPWPRQTTR